MIESGEKGKYKIISVFTLHEALKVFIKVMLLQIQMCACMFVCL